MSGLDTLRAVTGRHPDVGHHRIRSLPVDHQLEFGGVADHGDDIDRTVAHERAPHALPHQVVIVGDDHPQPAGHGRRLSPGSGNSAMTVVPAPGDGVDLERAADRGDPVAEVRQARAPCRCGVESGAVVAHSHDETVTVLAQFDVESVGAAVLEGVGERLGDREVRGALQFVGEAQGAQRGIRSDGHGKGMPARKCLDRHQQSPVAEHRRMDALREVAKVGEHAAQTLLHRLDVVADGVGVVLELLACVSGQPDEGGEVLLHAVMDVPLDATAFLLLGVHDSRA